MVRWSVPWGPGKTQGGQIAAKGAIIPEGFLSASPADAVDMSCRAPAGHQGIHETSGLRPYPRIAGPQSRTGGAVPDGNLDIRWCFARRGPGVRIYAKERDDMAAWGAKTWRIVWAQSPVAPHHTQAALNAWAMIALTSRGKNSTIRQNEPSGGVCYCEGRRVGRAGTGR